MLYYRYMKSSAPQTHSDLQPAPITVHISVVITHTMMKVRQFYILEMTKSFNDCFMQLCTPW